ncbi:MAG: hypothetical protein JWP89_5721 [Schlesneria sp.]|nr:hypothetical protein [Schlesneria sp.]
MSSSYRNFITLLILLAMPSALWACLWDYDTLRQERSRFPTTLELITGKFLRHSKEFYEWRIQDRRAKLAGDPTNMAYLDDLTVAYQLTGQHDLAIETATAQLEADRGRYETLSNLGTVYILGGDLEKGLLLIDEALEINPDAHFGRERYQKWLVEYAIGQHVDGELSFPMRHPLSSEPGDYSPGFAVFLKERLGKAQLTDAEIHPAVKGILGMMRFADYRNPLLLEALGDLLSDRSSNAQRLAARCYLKASHEVDDEAAKQSYRSLAEAALHSQKGEDLQRLEATFTAELAEADTWYSWLRKKEIGWIQAGGDVDAEFDRLYREDPQVRYREGNWYFLIEWAVSLGLVGLGLFLFWRRARSKMAKTSQ